MGGVSRRVAAWAGLVAQLLFVVSWLVAAVWQGPRYSITAHTISDMYAVTAPWGWVLVVVITMCGVATILFALVALWPALRVAGWTAGVGCALLALSIYGLGDALTPLEREACRLADDGCTAADQVANAGGALDAILSTLGIFVFVAATFFVAAAMKRTRHWHNWAWPARGVGIGFVVLLVILVATENAGFGGLMERLLAATGAAAIAAAATRVLALSRQPMVRSPIQVDVT